MVVKSKIYPIAFAKAEIRVINLLSPDLAPPGLGARTIAVEDM
jgi:hypothetical protein